MSGFVIPFSLCLISISPQFIDCFFFPLKAPTLSWWIPSPQRLTVHHICPVSALLAPVVPSFLCICLETASHGCSVTSLPTGKDSECGRVCRLWAGSQLTCSLMSVKLSVCWEVIFMGQFAFSSNLSSDRITTLSLASSFLPYFCWALNKCPTGHLWLKILQKP
jgi:hypothetical protein